MNENQTADQTVRPTKKQKEILSFIDEFIGEHGYSPSYREIMTGLQYTSVATVALHVTSLIKRGHLRKRDHSARSLEVVKHADEPLKVTSNQVKPGEEKWLVEKVEHLCAQVEQGADADIADGLEKLHTLVAALQILGLDGAAQSFQPRLTELKKRASGEQ